jgi:hypothetical protein
MSHIVVALIIVAAVILICLSLVALHNKQKQKAMNELINFFREAGTQNSLNFSCEEVLHNSVLGLDGVHRKMLVVTRDGNFFHSFLMDVNDIRNCTVKKIYTTIYAGDLKKHGLEQHLRKIVLSIELRGGHTNEILFFSQYDNHVQDIQELEKKARRWETFLTKMQKPSKKTA